MRVGRKVVYTSHTRERLHERGIAFRWVEAILDAPAIDEPDPAGDGRRRCWGRVPEFGDRMLRIVYIEDSEVIRVITVTPDRNRGRRTP
jgi:uncharacterized DUF497 family protein